MTYLKRNLIIIGLMVVFFLFFLLRGIFWPEVVAKTTFLIRGEEGLLEGKGVSRIVATTDDLLLGDFFWKEMGFLADESSYLRQCVNFKGDKETGIATFRVRCFNGSTNLTIAKKIEQEWPLFLKKNLAENMSVLIVDEAKEVREINWLRAILEALVGSLLGLILGLVVAIAQRKHFLMLGSRFWNKVRNSYSAIKIKRLKKESEKKEKVAAWQKREENKDLIKDEGLMAVVRAEEKKKEESLGFIDGGENKESIEKSLKEATVAKISSSAPTPAVANSIDEEEKLRRLRELLNGSF